MGVVLAGGAGQRMGGNKAAKKLGPWRLVDLALKILAQVCPRHVVVTSKVDELADLGCRILADRWPGQGPLAALATAFLDTKAEGILLMGVDMPLVRPALLRLLAQAGEGQRAVTPMSPKGVEPLVSYYHRLCLPAALRLLESGERRPRFLLKAVRARVLSAQEVAAADPEGQSFFNVNSPEDLKRAKELVGFF